MPPYRPSRSEDEAPQDVVAVEHGGDALFDDHGDALPRVLPADGALEAAELDVAAPVEAAGADLPPRSRGEVQLASGTGTGGYPRCGY